MNCTLGIDIGTSGAKMVLVDTNGNIIKEVTKLYPLYYPQPGWAEQHPENWWTAVKEGLKDLLQTNDTVNILGIGVSGQMHGLVALDKEGSPLIPAILWNDQRSHQEADYLNEVVGIKSLIEFTGNIAFPGFTAPKVLWLKKHKPEILKKVKYICLPKDYINYKLTGEIFTDVSDASGTLYFNVEKRKWAEEMLDFLDLKESMLPKVYESFEIGGRVNKITALELGLPLHTPVVAGAGDNAAGAVGANILEEGTILVSLGTSGVVFAPQKTYVPDRQARLHSFCDANGHWHIMGVTLSAASTLHWWAENIQKESYEVLLREASESPAGSKGLYFLPYLSGERTPHNDAFARGSFIGLNNKHSRGDMTRALLEGVMYSLYESIDIANGLQVVIKKIRAIGGGTNSQLWLQIMADVFGLPVEHYVSSGGPAIGAAMLAKKGIEVVNTFSLSDQIQEVYNPNEGHHKNYLQFFNVYRNLYKSLKKNFKEMYMFEEG
jgi:xylulokinase